MLARRPRLPAVVSLLTLGLLTVALAACPTPKSPKGPPPVYEEPPAPSWLIEGGADAGPAEAGPAQPAGPAEAGPADGGPGAPAPVVVPPG